MSPHMTVTIHTRKPIVKIRAVDLRAFPVWEFTLDEEGLTGHDETWVRPVGSPIVRRGVYSQIVATDFQTATGRKLQGFMTVSTANGTVDVQPGAVVGRFGYSVLPTISRALATHRRYSWSLAKRDRLLSALKAKENEVFPLRYQLRVSIRGENERRAGLLK